ncbi:MAG TPA: T9SS type A sorting domain-containing protein [Vicingus sp.]|nr:T9SS type A sorting domain-containing protein [Vicingus sp.]HRP61253.1 T9SS type A sorting domain-containing protein [Vicingus sp.]
MKKFTLITFVLVIFVPTIFFAQYSNAVRLKIEGNGYADETIVRLINDATPDFDSNYDAYKIISPNSSVPSIYSKIACSSDLSINSLPLYNKDTAIEIHTIIPVAGFYSITLEEVFPVDNSYQINLKEVNSNENINLTTASSKLIYLEPNNGNNLTFLFEISKILTTSFNELNNTTNDVIVNKGNGIFELHLKNDVNSNIKVFDVTGKMVNEQFLINKQIKIDLSTQPKGIYFIKTELFTHKILR